VEMHNALGITAPVKAETRTYSGWHMLRGGISEVPPDHPGNTRPHQVIFAGRIADPIRAAIRDKRVRALFPGGSVNQILVESSDALQSVSFCRGIKQLYQGCQDGLSEQAQTSD
jgi:hypothetical protein